MKRIILMSFLLVTLTQMNAQETQDVNINLEFVDNSYDGYQDFAKLSVIYLKRVITSEALKKELLKTKMKKTQGKTNEQIYNAILKGFEKQCPGRISLTTSPNEKCPKKTINNDFKCPENEISEINLKVRTINECDGSKWLNKNCELHSSAGTIGIDGNGDGVTAICPQRLEKWFKNKRLDNLAGHYMHEYMHIIGFSHRGIGKHKSAVYKIGYLVEKLVMSEMLKDNYECLIKE